MRHKTIFEKNLEKNTIIEEKLGAALSKSSSGLSTKKRKPPEIEKRESQVRRRFSYRAHTDTGTVTAVLEAPPAPSPTEDHSPSPDEIDEALESVQNTLSPQVEEPPPSLQTVESAPVPSVIPPPVPTEEPGISHSPATPYLTGYIGELSDSKNIYAYDLEQANIRLDRYRETLRLAQKDVDSAELCVLTLSDNIEKLDKNILACRNLQGMGLEVAPLLPHGSSAHKKTPHAPDSTKKRMSSDDPRLCRKVDVLAVMQTEPQRNWSASEIVEALPPTKRANGKKSVSCYLSVLNTEGQVSRITKGVYTFAKAVEIT